jgi:aminomethyltransferase
MYRTCQLDFQPLQSSWPLRTKSQGRVQHRLSGPGAASLLQQLTPTSIMTIPLGSSALSVLLHPQTGGIVDDTVVTRLGQQLFYLVTNAGCRDKDLAYLTDHVKRWNETMEHGVDWEVLENWGLIALQGPLSSSILENVLVNPLDVNLKGLYFGQSRSVQVRLSSGDPSVPIIISRGGYTGEDGFELSLPPDITLSVTESLLHSAAPEKLRLAGLGARDSLRLEAGMCLYGHDLNDTTTPVEASLGWIVSSDRRIGGGFFGDQIILQQLKSAKEGGSGVSQRRVGFVIEGTPAREGAEIIGPNGDVIGKITSGSPSPSLKKNIAMGYIKSGYHKVGTQVEVVVRGKRRGATVTKMPFVPPRYWRPSTPT